MDNKILAALESKLKTNIHKQNRFSIELSKLQSGSLVVITVHGDKYLYRKHREKDKIKSSYIGPLNSKEAFNAYKQRENYLKTKQEIKSLKLEEKKLRKMIDIYKSIVESVEIPTSEFSKIPPWNK